MIGRAICFSANPIEFLDGIIERHKKWLRERQVESEALRYMGENVDQYGRGKDFLKHCVHNHEPEAPDPNDPNTDLSLLQLYEYWRDLHGMRAIEAWDGTRLRPWLPPESNPQVPHLLQGDLTEFATAMYRGRPWGGEDQADTLDALGNAIESYFHHVRLFAVWGQPKTGGTIRLYRHTELVNLEVAPYSIRFWGFMRWADGLRRKMLGEPIEQHEHDEDSDITFMDKFNQNHFPWHDDVFANGKCPTWHDQYGLQKNHKYPRGTQGYALEFLEFHGDLLRAYNQWLEKMGRLPTSKWRSGNLPWEPGTHNTAYILKHAFSPTDPDNPWGLGGTNGEPMGVEQYASALLDDQLVFFESSAELGHYFEICFPYFHGTGHVERCDIRDQYLNNYSVRFFHWHQWIDDRYRKMAELRKPLYDPSLGLDGELAGLCEKFPKTPEIELPLTGTWTYRSYHNQPNPDEEERWIEAELELTQQADGSLEGVMRPTQPGYEYAMSGFVDTRNVRYETTPDWWDERMIIVLVGKGATSDTRGHEYEYRGQMVVDWPNAEAQVDALVGSVVRAKRPDDPTQEGNVGSFIAVRKAT